MERDGDEGKPGAALPGGDRAALEAEIVRLREGERHHLQLLEEADRRRDRSRAFMLTIGALSASDTLFRRGRDAAVAEILSRARVELEVSRAGVWLFDEERSALRCTSLDDGVQAAPSTERIFAVDAPGYFAAISGSRIIAAESARDDPRTRELTGGYFVPHGIVSTLDAPIRGFGASAGVVCLEQVGTRRRWSQEELCFAAAVGDLVALAIMADARDRAEGTAATTAARYRYLVESLPAAVYSLQPDAPVLDYLSPQIEGLTGHPPEHWIGGGDRERWLSIVHPEDRPRVLARFEHAPRSDDAAVLTYRFKHRDGSWRWVRDAFRLVRNADGHPLGLQGVLQDVTDAVNARRELDELRGQFHELIDRSDQLAVMLDLDGRITYANPALARLVGLKQEELHGLDWFAVIVPPDEREAVRAVFQRDTREGRIVPWYENSVLAADGSPRRLRWNNVVRRDVEGKVVGTASVGTDLTERLASETRLLEAQKFESLGRLAAGVAHDVNNLLTAVVGSADAAEEAVHGGEGIAGALEVIRESARKAGALTDSLLGFARRRRIAPIPLAIDPAVTRALGTLRVLLGGKITLETSLRADGVRVRIDPSGLDQVLLNLVVNAREAMPDGGRVLIATEVVFVDEDLSRRRGGLPTGAYVTLMVRDEGIGMDGATVGRIFEPFFTTKGAERGTGLGLSTSYGVVQQAGGTITVDSRVGGGSAFTVFLPRDRESTSDPAPRATPPAEAKGMPRAAPGPTALARAKRPLAAAAPGPVILVDDDPLVARVLGEGLRRHGFSVQIASSGAEALRLAAGTPPVRLLVSDVRLGDLDGRELARRFRDVQPEAMVVLVSGDIVSDIDENIAAVLQKPITPFELAARLRALFS